LTATSCQARHAFEEDVAVGGQADDQALDQILLPDNNFPDLDERLRN
jgi:hypothetical protein